MIFDLQFERLATCPELMTAVNTCWGDKLWAYIPAEQSINDRANITATHIASGAESVFFAVQFPENSGHDHTRSSGTKVIVKLLTRRSVLESPPK